METHRHCADIRTDEQRRSRTTQDGLSGPYGHSLRLNWTTCTSLRHKHTFCPYGCVLSPESLTSLKMVKRSANALLCYRRNTIDPVVNIYVSEHRGRSGSPVCRDHTSREHHSASNR